MRTTGDGVADARKEVLRDVSDYAHDQGRVFHDNPLLASEFRRLADRMAELYKRGTPSQLATFFGVAIGNGK